MPGCESVVEELLVAHVGIDWGEKKHHVSVCGEGRPGEVTSREVGARPESLQEWLKGLLQQYPEGRIAVYLESCRSGLRYFLMGYQRLELYLIATTASRHYRKMFYPSGAKSDPRDSELLLEMGYRHRDRFRPWWPETGEIRQLQVLVEDRRHWVDLKKGWVQQLRQALDRYFPQAEELVRDLSSESAWHLLRRWPRLSQWQRVRPATLQKQLQKLGCRRVPQRVEEIGQTVARAVPMTRDEATQAVMVLRVQSLTAALLQIEQTVAVYDEQIEKLARQQEETRLFRSFPGAGRSLAPRLVALYGSDRERFQDSQEVSQYTGIAPVQKSSGQQHQVVFRKGCPRFLRQTLHEFARQSIRFSPWARAHYDRQRALGKRHHCALRSLAFKWNRILYRCWKDQTPYQEQQHLEALRKRRSPVLEFLPEETRQGA
jgi:transposase